MEVHNVKTDSVEVRLKQQYLNIKGEMEHKHV